MARKDPEARKAYHREYMKRYLQDPVKHELHLARVARNNERRRKEIKEWIREYLIQHPCIDCGESDLDVLDFDHVRGKKSFNIAHAGRLCKSLNVLKTEVAKCDVRCANCHRRITRQRQRAQGSGVDWS